MGGVVRETTIDTATIPNYTIDMPVTMEFQVTGSRFDCCLRGIPNALLAGVDIRYASGQVGVKTYQMSGGFHDFAVFVP
jgi:hypothetical protein